MIQPLRTRHRWAFVILAIVLPLLFAAAIVVRDQTPAAPIRFVRGAR